MTQPYLSAVLLIGVGLAASLFAANLARQHTPGNHQGYSPRQPIEFSHRLHAEELNMNCRYCHSGAATSRHAGIPSGDVCMRCHKFVTASFDVMQAESRLADKEERIPNRIVSDELRKLYDFMALDDELQPHESRLPRPIPWTQVHNLPDHVYFDHRAHMSAGIRCQQCHGPVESMQRVEQFSRLSMGWCVNCHRDASQHGVQGQSVEASLDCTACHY